MSIEIISFLTLSFFVAISPGPSVVYVVSYSLRYGPKAGIISTLGINLGSIFAILIAAFGLASLLSSYPMAMNYIQLIGGLYVVYLAYTMWPREALTSIEDQVLAKKSHAELFKNGFITSILNPKDILFYTAFIPTFIPKGAAGQTYQFYFLLLALSYMTIGFLTKSTFAIFSGVAKAAFDSKNAHVINIVSALLLLGLGVFLVVKSIGSIL